MKNLILLSFLFACFLSSYGQTQDDIDKAFKFFDAVNEQITASKPAGQAFIDKMTVAMLAVNDNNKAKIDTKELQALLEEAKGKNLEKEKNIEKLVEVDHSIELKKVILEYTREFNEAFQNEFPKTIKILSERSDDRFERAKETLLPKLQVIKEKEIAMKKALKAFEVKYNELDKMQIKRTGADFEYIKVKDLNFTQTPLNDGAKIQLLSFSGGEDLNGVDIYYKQFIGIDQSTGDTLRILALALLQQYDLNKAIRTGTYKSVTLKREGSAAGDNEYIIFNKNQSAVEKGNYKTVFGLLEFDE